MSKELTPLEALYSFDHWIQVEFAEQFKIIENALKDRDIKRLEDIFLKYNCSGLNELEHRLKALEIIKNKVQKIKWLGFKYKDGTNLYSIEYRETPTKEEADLLNEVLK